MAGQRMACSEVRTVAWAVTAQRVSEGLQWLAGEAADAAEQLST